MSSVPKSILIVDDSRMSRMMIRAFIQAKHPGWPLAEAGGGEEALEEARECHFDLITIDYNMPGMTGTELVEKLQAMGVKAKLVILTANIQEPLRKRVESMGVRFVKKPISEQSIAEVLAVLDV